MRLRGRSGLISWGVFFVIIGLGTFILPSFGWEIRYTAIFGEYAPLVAIIALVIGIGLIVFGIVRNVAGKKQVPPADSEAGANQPTPPTPEG